MKPKFLQTIQIKQIIIAICESTWIESLVAPNLINDLRSGHSRLGATNGTGQNGAGIVVPKFLSVNQSKRVRTNLWRILETQPWLTRRRREISHGRVPSRAISTIWQLFLKAVELRRVRLTLVRTWFGSGRPFTKCPPSWFISPPPSENSTPKLIMYQFLWNDDFLKVEKILGR